MLKPFTLALALATAMVPLAHAQGQDDESRTEQSDRSYNDDASSAGDQDADQDRQDDWRPSPSERDMRHGDRWMRDDRGGRAERHHRDRLRPREMADRRGPMGPRHGPPPPPHAGFRIEMGRHMAVEIACGDENIADCVDAAKPILDAMKDMHPPRRPDGSRGAGPDAGRPVPPPPADLVEPSGNTPPATPAP